MDAPPPPPPPGGGAPPPGKAGAGAAAGGAAGAAANEVVPVFGGDAWTQVFTLIMLLLGMYKVRAHVTRGLRRNDVLAGCAPRTAANCVHPWF